MIIIPTHTSISPEKFAKIDPKRSEISLLCGNSDDYKKLSKNIGRTYSPLGRHAEWAER